MRQVKETPTSQPGDEACRLTGCVFGFSNQATDQINNKTVIIY